MGHVVHVQLDFMAVDVRIYVLLIVMELPVVVRVAVIEKMEYVMLAKWAIMAKSVIMSALKIAQATSVLNLRVTVMAANLFYMEKIVKCHVINVLMVHVIRTVVYAQKAVQLVFMGVCVMKRALSDARIVVTRLLRNVTLAKVDFMDMNAPKDAQTTAKMDGVTKIQGHVLMDAKR